MCGRFTQTKSRKEVLDTLGDVELPPLFNGGRYNIAPMQPVSILRTTAPQKVTEAIWGFLNPRSGTPIINARIETLHKRPLFRDLLKNHRCLILADGFYEWKDNQPYYFYLKDRKLFAFAGLWQDDHCVIITKPAERNMRNIHERMPVILPTSLWKDWCAAFQPLGFSPELEFHAVSSRVNRIVNDDARCVQRVKEQTGLSLFPDNE